MKKLVDLVIIIASTGFDRVSKFDLIFEYSNKKIEWLIKSQRL